jgi:hypothetical protein
MYYREKNKYGLYNALRRYHRQNLENRKSIKIKVFREKDFYLKSRELVFKNYKNYLYKKKMFFYADAVYKKKMYINEQNMYINKKKSKGKRAFRGGYNKRNFKVIKN